MCILFLCLLLKVPEALCFWVVRCPSVAQNNPLSTCTRVRCSIQLTVPILRPVHPSIHPSIHPGRFLVISGRTHGGNGLKCCMLIHPDRMPNWLDYGHGLLSSLILVIFLLSVINHTYSGFWAFPGKCMEGMAWNFACWVLTSSHMMKDQL